MTEFPDKSAESGNAAVLMTAESLFHADAIVAALADHDIEAMAAPDIQLGAGVHPSSATKPVRVLVHINDLDRAREALKQSVDDAEAINWDETESAGEVEGIVLSGARRREGLPLIAKLGLIAAVFLIIVMIVGTLLMFMY